MSTTATVKNATASLIPDAPMSRSDLLGQLVTGAAGPGGTAVDWAAWKAVDTAGNLTTIDLSGASVTGLQAYGVTINNETSNTVKVLIGNKLSAADWPLFVVVPGGTSVFVPNVRIGDDWRVVDAAAGVIGFALSVAFASRVDS